MRDLSDEQLRQVVEDATQELTRRMEDMNGRLKARFPRGYIRRLNDIMGDRWPYLDYERRRTIASVIQLCDVNRWHLNFWDIGLTAGTVWVWQCALPVIAIIETLLIEYGTQTSLLRENARFKKAINTLHSKGLYGHDLCDKLHDLREYRNEVHLYLRGRVGLHDGGPDHYNEAVCVLGDVENALKRHWERSRVHA